MECLRFIAIFSAAQLFCQAVNFSLSFTQNTLKLMQILSHSIKVLLQASAAFALNSGSSLL